MEKIENEDKAGKGLDTLRTLIRGALSPERILEILRDYVYFPDPTKEDDTTEIVCRYPQFFATRKLRDHILNHLRSVGGDGKGGTYFGATGCGKLILCCSLHANWFCDARSNWVALRFSS